MKKVLIFTALVLTIATSVIAGTLAVYNIDLGVIATGSVVAKEFKLTGAGDDQFATEVKIAPTETVTKVFTVSNYNGSLVTETPMKLDIDVDVNATLGKQAVPYLYTTVYKVVGDTEIEVGKIETGTGTISFEDGFNVQADGQTNTYKVVISWPDNNGLNDSDANGISDDAEFAGNGFGNTVTVSVSGTQVDDASSYIK